MKIAVIGSGGVGGYYGGLLAQQGHAVTCVAGALDVKNYTLRDFASRFEFSRQQTGVNKGMGGYFLDFGHF